MTGIRPLQPDDARALAEFLAGLPDDDRNFFKEGVLEPEVPAAWISDPSASRAVIADGNRIVAYAAVIPLPGWSSHVGEIRLVVAVDQRRRGLGRRLARWALLEAVSSGIQKLVVELVADQGAAITMFQELGFEGEALLRDHVRDHAGAVRDLVVLSHDVAGNRAAMETIGLGGIR